MKIRISKRDGLYVGCIGLDCGQVPGRITTSALGRTKAEALAKASQLAERIASDPVMRSLVPPQAMAALRVTRGLASAARRGLPTLRRAWGMLSPKSKRLAHTLAQEVVQERATVPVVGWNPFKRRKKKKRVVRKPDRELDEQQADNEDEGETE